MFIATRIANGIVCAIALLLSTMFLLGTGQLFWIGAKLGLVGSIYLFDLMLRKRNAVSDLVFASAWTILFTFASFAGLRTLTHEDIPLELGGNFVFGTTVVLLYVLPLVLNGIYLCRILMQKKPVL